MVTAWSPKDEAGGVSTVIRCLTKALAPGIEVSVLVNEWHSRRLRSESADLFRLAFLRLRMFPGTQKPLLNFLGWLRDLPRALLELSRYLSANRFDVVHLHYASSYQSYFRMLRLLRLCPPYVVTLHRGETVNFGRQSAVNRALTRWMLRGAARTVAVSPWLADLAQETFGCGDVGAIPNGIDLAEIEELLGQADAMPLPFAVPERYFLVVANITYYKGIDVAIRAFARLRPSLPEARLIVVGQGREQWDACQALIDELGCREAVLMPGALRRAQVFGLMKGAEALVCPSRNEGQGLVLLEAGAIGTPVICTAIGPFLMMATGEENALVVPADDDTALAAAMLRLAGDGALAERLAAAMQARVREHFTVERMAERYRSLYAEARGEG